MIHLKQISSCGEKIVGEAVFLFTIQGSTYEMTFLPSKEEIAGPSLVLSGYMQRDVSAMPDISQTKKLMQGIGITELFLMNSASHRQILDHEVDEANDYLKDKKLCKYQEQAKIKGCSIENPSLFFIQHAHCELINHIAPLKRRFEINAILQMRFPAFTDTVRKQLLEYEGGV